MAQMGHVREVLHTIRTADPKKIGIFYAGEHVSDGTVPYTLSYEDIVSLCDFLTSKLADIVAKRKDLHSHSNIVVGIVLPAQYAGVLPVVLLGLISAGLIIAVLDATDPRMLRMADSIGCQFVVEAGDTTGLLQGCTSIPLQSLLTSWLKMRSHATKTEVASTIPSQRSTGAIYFTSGSTGVPKACFWSCEPLLAYARAKNRIFSISECSTVFVASPPTFDPSLGDFFATMLAHATVRMVGFSSCTTSSLV